MKIDNFSMIFLENREIYIKNKYISRIKVFEPFEDVSKLYPSLDAMIISYGFVYERSSKLVMKGGRLEIINAARK